MKKFENNLVNSKNSLTFASQFKNNVLLTLKQKRNYGKRKFYD